MAQTLSQAQLLSQNDLQRGVLQTFVIESVVLDRLPFMPVQGNAFAWNEEATLPGAEFRAINAGYTESAGTFAPKTATIVPMGGDADVDRFLQQVMSNVNDQRAAVLAGKVKAITYKFQDTFINGDTAVDANSFNGLKKQLTGSQLIPAGTNGLAVLGADDAARHAFFDVLGAGISAVPGINGQNGAIYVNSNILGKLISSMRRLTMYTTDLDQFGKRVPFYNGIPILDIGTKADGTLILPQTETQGTATTASSIYVVKYGGGLTDRAVTGLTNGGVMIDDLGMLETKPALRHRVEFYTGLALFGPRAAARISGVLNA